jgi:hypothetical protein
MVLDVLLIPSDTRFVRKELVSIVKVLPGIALVE